MRLALPASNYSKRRFFFYRFNATALFFHKHSLWFSLRAIEGSCFFNTAAHRDVIQASCYPMVSKINCTTIVFKKFCITTRTRQGRSKPFLEREGFGFFVFGGVPRRTTKASAAHGRAASAQAQCTADAYFYAAPSLLMGESGYRLRFDVIFRNTPAFPAPLCRATVEQSETERFYPTSCR